jgi:hypothetical protein
VLPDAELAEVDPAAEEAAELACPKARLAAPRVAAITASLIVSFMVFFLG